MEGSALGMDLGKLLPQLKPSGGYIGITLAVAPNIMKRAKGSFIGSVLS
jgi:hypothetical protein